MTRNYLSICLLILALGLSSVGMAQTSKIKKDAIELLAKAKEQMAGQDYAAANKSFREMLELKTVLPTEMCYFFANTLYHLKQFENSLRFAEKYISLTGTGGEFYQETLELKELLAKEMEIIRSCQYCDSQGYVLERCQFCEGHGKLKQSCLKCYGHKEHKCNICGGEGVVISKNHFGQNNYQTCQSCSGTGIQVCKQCNGKGILQQECQYCNGRGSLRNESNELCTHPHEAEVN